MWVTLLQKADHSFLATALVWVHQLGAVLSAQAGFPVQLMASYLLVWLLYLLVLWRASSARDRDRMDDQALVEAAAAHAASSRHLVQSMLPAAVSNAIRARLLAGLSPSVAFAFPSAVLLQSDIVGFTSLSGRVSAETMARSNCAPPLSLLGPLVGRTMARSDCALPLFLLFSSPPAGLSHCDPPST